MDIRGKRCLITGGTAGIGEAAAVALSKMGGDVVIVGRSDERCKNSLKKMSDTNGGGDLGYLVADLSSRWQVLKLAGEFRKKYDRLDVLVNNAGAIFFGNDQSVDGIEMTWALNHFGYFWLTLELLDLLKNSAPARIVNVSSAAHQRARLNRSALIDKRNNFAYFTYGNTKLANLLFTAELARRLDGKGITVNALHPGVVATRFGANNGFMGSIYNVVTGTFGISCEEGARTIVYLASSPDVANVSGKYFVKERQVASSKQALDLELAKALWKESEQVTAKIDAQLQKFLPTS